MPLPFTTTKTGLASVLSNRRSKKKDPLESAIESNERSRSVLARLGQPDPTDKPSPSALERIFGVMDVPGAGVRSLVHNAVNNPTDSDVNPLAEMGKAFRGEQRLEGSHIAGDFGVQNKWAKMGVGLAIDILLDPTTYLTGGIGGAGKSAVTGVLDDLARGAKTLDQVLDAGKAAKYASEVEKAGSLVALPKAVSESLYDDVARAMGYKGGVKFAGIQLVDAPANVVGNKVKSLLRGKPESSMAKATEWFERAFIHDELTPLFREGNEVVKAFASRSRRRLSANLHVGELFADQIEGKIASLVPDPKVRALITKGIGEQFGKVENLVELSRGFQVLDAARKAGGSAAVKTASEALIDLRRQFFDPSAIKGSLETAGVSGDELTKALEGAKFVQSHFDDLLGKRGAAGLEARSLFGVTEGEGLPRSSGYVPGMEPWRYGRKEQAQAESLAEEVLGAKDLVSPEHRGLQFGTKRLGPASEQSKTFLTPKMRTEGVTVEDLARGVTQTDRLGIKTEMDIAALAGARTRKDTADIAFKQFSDDATRVLGDDPKLQDILTKSKDLFTQDEATKGFLRLTDKALNTWRKFATIYNFPMFPARNWLSNKFLMATEGVLDPDAIGIGLKLATGKGLDETFVLGALGKMKGADILDLARSRRVAVGQPEIAQLVGKTGSNLADRIGGKVNQVVEDSDRIASFVAGLRKGLDPDSAAELVDRALYNYAPDALTTFEQNVMRRLLPFYTFARRNTPHMAELLATKPGALTWVGHAKQVGEDVTGISSEEQPSYLRNLFAIPLPNGQMLSTGGVLPISDLERIAPQSPGEYAREQLTSLNPFVRDILIEFPLNKDIYRDTDIESYSGELRAAPDYVQLFDKAVRSVPVASKLWDRAKSVLGMDYKKRSSGESYLAMNPYAAKAMKDFMPWMSGVARGFGDSDTARFSQLTGVKLVPADTQDWERQKVYEDSDALGAALRRLRDRGEDTSSAKKSATLKHFIRRAKK